ncbi:MAG: DUF484 family protein [Deltaproteobacteria bacterium]
MSSQPAVAAEISADNSDDIRARILSAPEVVLNDTDVMRALIAATDADKGRNIVDLRGVAMNRLEGRLGQLENTHKDVLAAAYENVAGTNLIHRAVLMLLEASDFAQFLALIDNEIPRMLRLDALRLVIETTQNGGAAGLAAYSNAIVTAEPGFIGDYMSLGATPHIKPVVLRPVTSETEIIYGDTQGWIRSEAAMRMDLGSGRLPAMLVLGSENPHQFEAGQGTDLLVFFAGVFSRALRRWID